jgi:hypothetical protein
MVQRITPKVNEKPVANATLRKPDGSTYLQLPANPLDPDNLAPTQKIDPETGYFGKTVVQLNNE